MPGGRGIERGVVGLVAEARLAVHDYGTRPVKAGDVSRLATVFNMEFGSADISIPVILFPPVDGKYQVIFQDGLAEPIRRYATLHELAHVLRGDVEEPTRQVFDGPLPEGEDVCDLFALLGIVDPAHDGEGADWIEEQIRLLVPLDDKGWQVHRIPRLAKKLPRVRDMVRNLHGYF